ncbi:MAG: tetratricopeptide repeat protein [Prosthecobacter sp.]|uniref:tetratricopeptide repeat protein n=1 Tax=Prosthecobacter sp. TaxID=1965333 RepID=UPI0039018D09
MSTPPQSKRRRKHLSPSRPETVEQRAARSRQEQRTLILFVAAMLVFGIGCWLAFPHVTQFARQWLGRRHLPELRRHIKDENWQQAAAAMREAKRWVPNDPDVNRACLEFITTVSGDPRTTIGLIRQLQEMGAATSDDLALLGKMHAKLGETAKAREIYAQLPLAAHQQPHSLELQAELLKADGHYERATEVQREALKSSPVDAASLRQLAAIDTSSSDPSRRSAMRERLWQIARSDSPLLLTAIELLAMTKELTVPQAEELFQIIEASPLASARRETARFILLSARMRLSPQLRADIIDQEVVRWKNRPPAQTTPLVAWLAEEHENARLLRMVSAQAAALYTDLLPHYVNALRGEGKWQDLNTLLTKGGIDSAYPAQKIRLWQVEAQFHLHADPSHARQTLARIFEEAGRGDDPATTLQAGNLAEQLNQWDLAEQCYQAIASKHSRTQPAMLAKVYQMADYQHDGPGMLKTCTRLLALQPESTVRLTQKLYLQLLLGIDLETAQQELLGISQPDDASHIDRLNLLRALAAYRQGQLDLVRTALPGVAKPASLAAGERAVYAALLKLTGGDAGTVFRLVERIPPPLLLPEEKTFLQRAL